MKGLELSRKYFEQYGLPMLESEFPYLLPYIAAGFTGRGSERYGFDDDISQDHDFEPGFCIFLPGENVISRREAFLLERAYAKLPKEFCGFVRQPLSPVGGERNGVIRTEDFFEAAAGSPDGNLSVEAWLRIPDYALAEAVNGEVFYDEYGQFSAIRRALQNMPTDAKLKRIAGNLLVMAQSGQYNFARCCAHGEFEAAQLACGEFVNAALKVFFLLRGKYAPFYKWSFRALRQLDGGEEFAEILAVLLRGDNRDEVSAELKKSAIEAAAEAVIKELVFCRFTKAAGSSLEEHAYSVNSCIEDGNIRNLNILTAV